MIPVVTAQEMRRIDEETIRDFVPGSKLMDNAGRGVAEEIIRSFKPKKRLSIVVVCGKGNNGGDGFVVSRLLKRKGYAVKTYLLGKIKDVKGDAAFHLKKCQNSGVKVREVDKDNLSDLEASLQKAALVVDAIFGTGFEGEPRGLARQAIEMINAAPGIKVAIDVPSGVNSSTGEASLAVGADLTVTMALPKRGHLLFPGRSLTGEVIVHDIGVPPEVIVKAGLKTFILTRSDVVTALPDRSPQAHKWTCGFVAAICGSTGFTGAATLTSISALKAGAGLVTLAVPKSLNTILEVKLTEVMTLPVEETHEGTLAERAKSKLLDFVARADAVAIGPGLSQNAETAELIREIVPTLGKPCVLDADGINAFAGQSELLKGLDFPLVLTPHAGEAARLLGKEKSEILAGPIEFSRKVAEELGLILVLKGAPSFIASPDGYVFINPTGNQGLATAGSGDVLTGIIAGLLAQGTVPLEAACAGVFIHGLLGDMLLDEKGYYGFLAGELAERIPNAIASILSPES